jgi:hypothetical protein
MQEEINRFLSFFGKFLLTHLIWIIPIVVFLWSKQTLLWAVFLPFFTTLVYLSWSKKKEEEEREQELVVVKLPKLITFLYYVSVFIFLALTGIATYEGIVKVFGLEDGLNFLFVISFAVGIPLVLFSITLMVKIRKTPLLILAAFILYLLFDGLTALPYNFLFFYDHLTARASIEQDNNRFVKVINACDAVIAPKIVYYDSIINHMQLKKEQEIIDARGSFSDQLSQTEDAYNQKIDLADSDSLRLVYQKNKDKDISKLRQSEIKGLNEDENKLLIESRNDSMRYARLSLKLDSCRILKLDFDLARNYENKVEISNNLKNKLESVCTYSKDTLLMSFRNELRPYKSSSIQSIRHFYTWLGETILGTKNNSNENIMEREERKMLTIMSLTTSIVIDILPLLLSFLFVFYKRND